MIHVIATITLNPGVRKPFLDVFRWVTPLVRAEAGCIEYQATVDVPTTMKVQDGPHDNVVTVVEKWESVDALYAHTDAPHMVEYREKVKDYVSGVKLVVSENA
ncbi:antibiotic biosynthesis monooxygenase [Gemmata sp. JC673]|uniref:Antibiotic biosynthesis monooxygenase n=1 Tax=Gemmata algarum TaxID=2975278 RepID=A0ABU5F1F2_9BACT|nr:putative quinol monooxygenase [Gemmata algarum]MDY3561412.1 antibiotic biosynthesis monooxygenase [Gemmata algarum]